MRLIYEIYLEYVETGDFKRVAFEWGITPSTMQRIIRVYHVIPLKEGGLCVRSTY